MYQHFRARVRIRFSMPAIAAFVLGFSVSLAADSPAQAASSIGFHYISAGGHALTNSCYRMSGTAGQPVPGYSSATNISVVEGFWTAAPTTGLDEIFFNGFEDC
jgi:hypothetical protein